MSDHAQSRIDAEALLLTDLALKRGMLGYEQVRAALDAFAQANEDHSRDTLMRLVREHGALSEGDCDALLLDLDRRVAEAGGNPRLALLRTGTRAGSLGTPAAGRAADEEAGDRYVGFRALGQGGMGVVYVALDSTLSREVAYKVMRPASLAPDRHTPRTPIDVTPPEPDSADSAVFDEHVLRFLQEARITGYLEHPGIVPVYELGTTSAGVPYYTMRVVRGKRTLSDALKEAATDSFERRLALLEPFLKVCDAVHYAHEQGISHRDLKPANIGLGDYGEVVVLDWGLARLSDREDLQETKFLERLESLRSSTGVDTESGALGTPGYMSPEAAEGRVAEMDARGDVFSLGVILFEILAGRLPYPFASFAEYVGRVITSPAPLASDVDASIPQPLVEVCAAALSRDREQRPASAGELAERLRAWQIQSRLEQKIQSLSREAHSAMEAAEALSGTELVHQLDRVTAPCHRILDVDPGHAEAASILRRCAVLRDRGVEEQAARARKLQRKRVAVAALALITLSTLIFSRALAEKKHEAEAAQSRAEGAEQTVRRQLSQAYADLAHGLTQSGRHAAAHLAAARALDTLPTRAAWASLGQVARHTYPVPSLMGSGFEARSAALHPDGRRLFVGCADGKVRAWDLEGGTALFEFRAHESEIRSLLVSRDGRRLLTGGISSEISLVRVWDLATRKLVESLEGFTGLVLDMRLGPTGKHLYALDASTDEKGGGVHVWDLSTGKYVWRVGPSDAAVTGWKSRSMCLSPDGKHIFLGSREVIVVWSVLDRRPVRTLRGGWGVVSGMTVSPDGSRLIAAYRGDAKVPAPRPILVWDWRGGTVAAKLDTVPGGVRALHQAEDGSRLFATTVATGDLVSWDLDGGGARRSHGAGVPLLLSGGRDLLVSAHPQDSIRLLHATGEGPIASPRPGHTGEINHLALHEGSGRLLSLGAGGEVGVWTAATGALEFPFHAVDVSASALATLPDQPEFYVINGGTKGERLELRSIRTGKLERALVGHDKPITAIVVAPDGSRVFSADAAGHIHASFPQPGDKAKLPERLIASHGAYALAIARDGKFLFFGSTGGNIGVFDLEKRKMLGTLRADHGRVTCLAVGPAPDSLYSGGSDGRVLVWEVPRGSVMVMVRPAVPATEPGGRAIPAVYEDRGRPFHAGVKPLVEFVGHSAPVAAVVAAKDYAYSVAADDTPWVLQGAGYEEESTIRRWDLWRLEPAGVFDGHRGWVNALALDAAGSRLYSGGKTDRTLIRWGLDAHEPGCVDVSAAHDVPSGGSPTFCLAVSSDTKRLYAGTGGLELFGRHYGATHTLAWDLGGRGPPGFVRGLSLGGGACGMEDGRSMLLSSDGARLFVGRWDVAHGSSDGGGPCGGPEPAPVAGPAPAPAAGPVAAPVAAAVAAPRPTGARFGPPPPAIASREPLERPAREPNRPPPSVLVGIADLASESPKPAFLALPQQRDADAVLDMALSGDGAALLVAGRSGTAYEFSVAKRVLVHTYEVDAGPASSIAVAPPAQDDGLGALFIGTRRGLVSVWDRATGRETRRFRAHAGGIGAMVVSPDGKRLYTAGGGRGVPDEESAVLRKSDALVKMWDVRTGGLLATMDGHADYVEALDVTFDGGLLVSAGRDGVVRLWDAKTGAARADLDATAGAVRAMALTRDGERLFTGGHDPRIFEWRLAWFAEAPAERLARVQRETGLRVRANLPDVEIRLWNHLVERESGALAAGKR